MKKILHLNSQSGYDLHAPFYDKKLTYLNSFEKNELLNNLPNLKNKTILDVGAGTGRLATILAKRGGDVTALDVSKKILNELKKKNPDIKTIIADAENLPLPGSSFDIIIAAFLIVHLKDPKYFFVESHRILKSGGQLIITNINQKRPPTVPTKQGKITIESYYHHPKKIINQLESLGFEIQKNIFVRENKKNWINQIIFASPY